MQADSVEQFRPIQQAIPRQALLRNYCEIRNSIEELRCQPTDVRACSRG